MLAEAPRTVTSDVNVNVELLSFHIALNTVEHAGSA
jgi:hypothetical protein